MDKVFDFIKRRFFNCSDDMWQNGNCYWFAHILCSQFEELEIYYDYINGHFIAGDGVIFYDSLGHYIPENPIIKLSDIKEIDNSWYNKLMRDCKD